MTGPFHFFSECAACRGGMGRRCDKNVVSHHALFRSVSQKFQVVFSKWCSCIRDEHAEARIYGKSRMAIF
jgi:hypothetical protein